MFRMKTGIRLTEIEQGYIYYYSKLYRRMPKNERETIGRAAERAGGEDFARAVLEFVTTDASATYICLKHNLSKSTLYRGHRKYYEIMAEILWRKGKK